jgi:hypothetical protein
LRASGEGVDCLTLYEMVHSIPQTPMSFCRETLLVRSSLVQAVIILKAGPSGLLVTFERSPFCRSFI